METRSPSPHNNDTFQPHITCGENQTAEVDRAFLVSLRCSTKLHDKKQHLLPTVHADTRAGTLVSRSSSALQPEASRTHSSSSLQRKKKNRGVSAAAVPRRGPR